MTECENLERWYRRLLACYPRAFRHEHEEEILSVLMAGAEGGRRRPGLAESADVIRSAAWMRVRPGAPRTPRTVSYAVKFMYIAAVMEVAALLVTLATVGALKSAAFRSDPGLTTSQWNAAIHAHVLALQIGAPVAAAVWLLLAWGNGRGRSWARLAAAGLFGVTSLSLLTSLSQGAATLAPADVAVGGLLWLVALGTVVLLFRRESAPFYRRAPVRI
jgi:hypothetical protein